MMRYLKVVFVLAIILLSGCSSPYQELTPTIPILENTATVTRSLPMTAPISTSTPFPAGPTNCLTMETTPLVDFKLDGTIIMGNLTSQSIYTLSTEGASPQFLLGKDPSWSPNYRLSPDGKKLAHSILSDDGLSYTALEIKSLNGDQVWEIPYQADWSNMSAWINNEQIEMIKSDTNISTTNPYTGTFVINPFKNEVTADTDATNLNLKPATIPYYDPTVTRMIYLRDVLIPESGEALVESIVIAEIYSGKELWVREDLGRDYLLASWSADGKQVAIQDYMDLTVVNIDEGWDRELQRDDLKLDVSSMPVWSPDGRYVAVKTYDSLAIYDSINDVLVDFCLHNTILNFSWSPSGHQLAVGGWLSDGSSYTLVIDVTAKVAVSYVGTDFVLLGWSDAGKK